MPMHVCTPKSGIQQPHLQSSLFFRLHERRVISNFHAVYHSPVGSKAKIDKKLGNLSLTLLDFTLDVTFSPCVFSIGY